jgi:hypothetical protein
VRRIGLLSSIEQTRHPDKAEAYLLRS